MRSVVWEGTQRKAVLYVSSKCWDEKLFPIVDLHDNIYMFMVDGWIWMAEVAEVFVVGGYIIYEGGCIRLCVGGCRRPCCGGCRRICCEFCIHPSISCNAVRLSAAPLQKLGGKVFSKDRPMVIYNLPQQQYLL